MKHFLMNELFNFCVSFHERTIQRLRVFFDPEKSSVNSSTSNEIRDHKEFIQQRDTRVDHTQTLFLTHGKPITNEWQF